MQKIVRAKEGKDFEREVGVAFVDAAFDTGEALEEDPADARGGGIKVV